MPLDPIGKNVRITDFQDGSLDGVAPVLLFETQAPTPTSCPYITRVIIGNAENQLSAFAAAHVEQPLGQFSGSCLAGRANIVRLAADGTELDRQPRFLFVSQTEKAQNPQDPPVATQISLAFNPDGLPPEIEKAYQAGKDTCYKALADESTRLWRFVKDLQLAFNRFQDEDL